MVRAQALLTELVFEHSFRIRFKAETPANGSSSVSEGSGDGDQSNSMASKGKARMGDTSAIPPTRKKDNLVGKVNTLVTVDVDNILSATDFLVLCAYNGFSQAGHCLLIHGGTYCAVLQVPMEIVIAVTFLYVVLGWR